MLVGLEGFTDSAKEMKMSKNKETEQVLSQGESSGKWHEIGLFRVIANLLIAVYLIGVVCFGYWYWMRPVRADQFTNAQIKWRETAIVFMVPVPKDERWGV